MYSISNLKTLPAIAIALSLALSALAPDSAFAITKQKRTLTTGKSVSVRGVGCNLTVKTNTLAKIGIRCKGAPTSLPLPRGKNVIGLRVLDSATITAQTCNLTITKQLPKRVNITCAAIVTVTPTATPTVTPTANANALLTGNQIVSFNTSNPTGADAPVALTGVTAGDVIVSIDRRPINGYLYGLGNNSTAGTVTLYAINPANGVATAIGSPNTFVDENGNPDLVGTTYSAKVGIDFNPTADRLRVVAANQQNFRVNPNSGALVDGNLANGTPAGVNMDGRTNGETTSVQEGGYTNSFNSTTATTLYAVDAFSSALFIQNPPNNGTETLPVAISPSIYQIGGFDIDPSVTTASSNTAPTSGLATVIASIVGQSRQSVATIDLISGALVELGALGDGTGTALGLALQTPADRVLIALDQGATSLVRFGASTPGTTTSVALTGITSGEVVVGWDFRPATGQLIGLGVNAGADTGTLYVIDPMTGAATVIGTPSSIAMVDTSAVAIDLPSSGTGYGVNFNPVVDRVRVVTGSGLNFRINPNTGLAVDSDANAGNGINPDTNLSGAVTGVQSASYTNGFAGATNTTLYTIDSGTDSLYIQSPPNGGILGSAVAVTLGGSALDFSGVSGFEIPSTVAVTADNTAATGSAFAVLTVGGVTGVYTIDLASGAATFIGALGAGTNPIYSIAASVITAK